MDKNELLTASRTRFMQLFSDSLETLIQRSIADLFAATEHAPTLLEEGRLRDARAILLNQGIALKRQLLATMERLLNRSFQTAYDTFRPSFGNSQFPSSLALVDTNTFEDELQVEDMARQFRIASEDQLRDLNIRIALLFGQEEIRERENPFRPYLFARCIVTALETIETAPELISILGQQLTQNFTDAVSSIYAALNELQGKSGIAAQLQLKIIKTPEQSSPPPFFRADATPQETSFGLPAPETDFGLAVKPGTGIPPPSFGANELIGWVHQVSSGMAAAQLEKQEHAAPHAAYREWLAGAQRVGQRLREFFAPPPSSASLLQPGESGNVDASELLAARAPRPATAPLPFAWQTQTPPTAAMQSADGHIRNLILERRDELSALSHNENEQMIIDIVAMLFEFILRDNQLPAEVRAQLGRLQLLVLKIALLDPALFSQKNHPARLLVNRIGSIVLGLQQIDPNGERVTAEICKIVETLLADPQPDATLFASMLDEFDRFVAAELRTADQQADRTVMALENAESRTRQFAYISGKLSEALTRIKLDPYLHDFLTSTWTRVIERAGRNDAELAKRMRLLVPDLVWSIAPKPAADDRKQLLGLIPELLRAMREGLNLISWPVLKQNELHNWLIDTHRKALRQGITSPGAPVPPRFFVHGLFEDFINAEEIAPEAVATRKDLDGQLLDEAIQEMKTELRQFDQVFDLNLSELGPESIGTTAEEIQERADTIEQLRSGVTIDILLGNKPTRAYLLWVSKDASHIVLNIENQTSPTILKVRAFLRLLEAHRIRFRETAPLFERAVHSLLESADHLDERRPVLPD